MSLGWGLRGQFGGPRGAMAPGALIALALVLVARGRYSARQVWQIAAAGALGFGIGGEETYMQTVAFTAHASTALKGWIGLLLKGAEWGGIGGLFLGYALGSRRYRTSQILIALNVALALSFVSYWLINEPKLIYFSGGGASKPRPEGWAGLWTFYLVTLGFAAWARDRITVRISLFGALGCGLGFVLGVAAYRYGDLFLGPSMSGFMDWWKVAECGFGLIGGLVIGWAWNSAGRRQETGGAEQADESESAARRGSHPIAPGFQPGATLLPPNLTLALLGLDFLLFFAVADAMDGLGGWIGKAPFLFFAPALMLLALRSDAVALTIGAAIPVLVTYWNVERYFVVEHNAFPAGPALAVLILLSAGTAALAAAWAGSPRRLLLLVAWGSIACAWVKMGWPPGNGAVFLVVQGILTLMAAWLTLVTRDRPVYA